jgi:hypothetical protein
MSGILTKVGALVVCGLLGVALVPGCVIHIGPGDGESVPSDPLEEVETTENPPLSPEEQALVQVDPLEFALLQAKAGYMSYMIMGTIETQGYDPNAIDDETLNQLAADLIPWASDVADDWVASQDVVALKGTYNPTPMPECHDLYGCPYTTKCPGSMVCIGTDCDSGKCRPCPAVFELGNLIVKSWCAYVCMSGKKTTGIALMFHPRLGGGIVGPFCIP